MGACPQAGFLLVGKMAGPQVLGAPGEGVAVCPAGGLFVPDGEWAGDLAAMPAQGPAGSRPERVPCSLGCVSLSGGRGWIWRP